MKQRIRWLRNERGVSTGFVEVRIEEFQELLEAAQAAVSEGYWRGPMAIRAYSRCLTALRMFDIVRDFDEEAVDREAPRCTCPTWPCPRHRDEVARAS